MRSWERSSCWPRSRGIRQRVNRPRNCPLRTEKSKVESRKSKVESRKVSTPFGLSTFDFFSTRNAHCSSNPRMTTFDLVEPATGQRLASVPEATREDVDRVVRAADRAFAGDWRRINTRERGRILLKLASLIREN